MTIAVIIDVAPTHDRPSDLKALLESCNLAMQSRGSCEASGEELAGAPAAATVSWDDGSHLVARIQIALRGSKDAPLARVVSFTRRHSEVERWRSVGLAIATLLSGASPSTEDAPSAVPSRAEPHEAVPPIDRATASRGDGANTQLGDHFGTRTKFWVDGDAVLSSGSDVSNPARGGSLRISLALDHLWFATGSARYTVQPLASEGFSIAKFETSAGLGCAAVIGQKVGMEWIVEFLLQSVGASGVDAAGASGQQSRWVPGIGIRGAIHWMLLPHVGIGPGIAITGVTSPTEIRAHGAVSGRVPALDMGLAAGARVTLP